MWFDIFMLSSIINLLSVIQLVIDISVVYSTSICNYRKYIVEQGFLNTSFWASPANMVILRHHHARRVTCRVFTSYKASSNSHCVLVSTTITVSTHLSLQLQDEG